MKIKVINPNTTLEMTEGIGEAARSVARAGTEIVAVSPRIRARVHRELLRRAGGGLRRARRGAQGGG